MFLIGFGFNKTLFLVILASDILLLIAAIIMKIMPLIVYVIIAIALLSLKYIHFRMSYKVVNKRYIIMTTIAIFLSIGFEVYVCIQTIWLVVIMAYLRAIPGFVVSAVAPLTVSCKVIMLINLYMMNRFVKWGMEIPVTDLDGAFRNKVDRWAAYLPFD